RGERGGHALAAFAVEGRDAVAQPPDRRRQIFALARQAVIAPFDLRRLAFGDEIDRPHIVALAYQPLEPIFRLAQIRQFFPVVDIGAVEYLARSAFETFGDPRLDFAALGPGMVAIGLAAHPLLPCAG